MSKGKKIKKTYCWLDFSKKCDKGVRCFLNNALVDPPPCRHCLLVNLHARDLPDTLQWILK